MMRRSILAVSLAAVLAVPGLLLAGAPGRPAAVTGDQLRALNQMEQLPEHQAVLKVHATYTSERERNLDFTRASDDFWTVVWDTGFPGTILAVIICAGPY
jgi:hypothetical protein